MNETQTIKIHIFDTQPLIFELPVEENVVGVVVVPEIFTRKVRQPERIAVITTNKVR